MDSVSSRFMQMESAGFCKWTQQVSSNEAAGFCQWTLFQAISFKTMSLSEFMT
jgi:hypothetical protein